MKRFGHPYTPRWTEVAVWQPARELFPHDDVARVRHPVDQRERAADSIVIGDGDEVHAARLRDRVDRFGRGIAVARANEAKAVVMA